jgi:hypothetical protein
MSKVIFATKMQQEVISSDSRITVITAEPGSGSTMSLVLKAIQSCSDKNINATFFVPTTVHATVKGGVVQVITDLLKDEVRYSDKSMIFSFKNGSKIKIIPCHWDHALEASFGLSRDLMLFDSNINDKFLVHHLPRAYESVVVDSICNIEKSDSWARQLNLVKLDEHGNIISFVEGVNHVKGFIDENFLFNGDTVKYKELVVKHIPENMRVSFLRSE